MRNTRVHNLIIVDASGSMSRIYNQALSGINETLNTIRIARKNNKEIEQYVSLLSFADGGEELQYICKHKPIEDIKKVLPNDYTLRGMTALYDAVGISVTRLTHHVKEGDRVLVTIITDGYENDSREWSKDQLTELIDGLRKEDWVFTFIGADQDVEEEAAKMGIENTLRFEATIEGTEQMFERERSARLRWNTRISRDEEVLEGCYFNEVDMERVTPRRVDTIDRNEVFVFGSNIYGNHNGNCALLALRRFGAMMGKAEGMQGQSYAIPTVGLAYAEMEYAIERFIRFASNHPEKKFLVTRIGCGSAGYTDGEMARLFMDAKTLENVALPQEWWNIIL